MDINEVEWGGANRGHFLENAVSDETEKCIIENYTSLKYLWISYIHFIKKIDQHLYYYRY